MFSWIPWTSTQTECISINYLLTICTLESRQEIIRFAQSAEFWFSIASTWEHDVFFILFFFFFKPINWYACFAVLFLHCKKFSSLLPSKNKNSPQQKTFQSMQYMSNQQYAYAYPCNTHKISMAAHIKSSPQHLWRLKILSVLLRWVVIIIRLCV